MLLCEKCGVDNPLGRVFCIGCGGKLDLENMTSDQVAESQKQSFIAMHWPKFVALLVIILLGTLGMALWPQAAVVGKPGKPNDARRVSSTLRTLATASRSEKSLDEKDVNGYFEFRAKKELKGTSISVDVQKGWCSVRVIKSFGKLDLKVIKIPMSLSYDLKCIPVGGVLHVGGASIGHVGVIGPLKTMAIRQVFGTVSALKDWKSMKNITKIEMDDDKIVVTVKK